MRLEKIAGTIVVTIGLLVTVSAFVLYDHEQSLPEKQTLADPYIPFGERYLQENYLISPYDSLIRAWSDSSGLDWRLVSAVVYHESHFKHDAVSRRGATGLMQMMPRTAASFGADSLLDASQSVMAGTRYLRSLYRRYSKVAANPTEQQKFMLAAYNCGAGRMTDLLNYARYRSVDPGYWDNLVGLIPEMRSDSILVVDTVKLGKFHGYETIDYVEAVMSRYQKYKRIAP